MKQRNRTVSSRLGSALILTAATVLATVMLAPAALATPAPTGQSPAQPTTTQIGDSAVLIPPAATAAATVTIRNADGRLEDFWRGSDCALWHQWQDSNGNWTGGPASLGGCLIYDIDVSRNADGRLEAFGIGTNHEMFHIWQLATGGWSGWASLGGNLVSRPWSFNFSSTDRRIYVDALGPDGIWHRKQQNSPNCCWSGWIFGVAH